MMNKLSMIVAAAALAAASSVQAATLIDFKSSLNTPSLPEFKTNGGFETDIGSTSNGLDVAGGLLIETPYTIPGVIDGKTITATGSTLFDDVTLVVNLPITSTANAFGFHLKSFAQGGTFAFYASNPTNPTAGVLLLSGVFSGTAALAGAINGSTAGVLDNEVTYTGGLILSTFGISTLSGTAAISLNDVTPGLSTAAFVANGTGLFSSPVIPEPASMSWVALGGLGLLARRRK